MNNWISLFQHSFWESFAWTLMHSLWQGAILFVFIRIALLFTQKEAAQLRHFIFLNSLLLFALVNVLTFLIVQDSLRFAANETTSGLEALTLYLNAEGEQELVKHSQQSFYVWAFLFFWIIGVLFMSVRLLVGIRHLQALKKTAIRIEDSLLLRRWKSLAETMEVRQNVRFAHSSLIAAPVTFGYLKPIVLIPIGLMSNLPMDQLELIIRHELMHIKRRDYLINWFQSIMEVLFFFNPLVWWLSAQLRKERENCCDDGVVRYHDPLDYAKALSNIEANRLSLQQQNILSVANNKNQLLIRIQRLMKAENRHSSTFSKLIVASSFILGLAFISWIAPAQETSAETWPTVKMASLDLDYGPLIAVANTPSIQLPSTFLEPVIVADSTEKEDSIQMLVEKMKNAKEEMAEAAEELYRLQAQEYPLVIRLNNSQARAALERDITQKSIEQARLQQQQYVLRLQENEADKVQEMLRKAELEQQLATVWGANANNNVYVFPYDVDKKRFRGRKEDQKKAS